MEVTEFFRCITCGKSYEMRDIGPGCRCGSRHFRPTILTGFEVFKYLLTHPRTFFDTYVYPR